MKTPASSSVIRTNLQSSTALQTESDQGGLESVQAEGAELVRAGEGGEVELSSSVSHRSHLLPGPAGTFSSLKLAAEALRGEN